METKLRTAKEARAWLRSHGVSVSEFARKIGVSRDAVNDLLRGRGQGMRGEAHIAAIKLGMKHPPHGEPPFSLEDQLPSVSEMLSGGNQVANSAAQVSNLSKQPAGLVANSVSA